MSASIEMIKDLKPFMKIFINEPSLRHAKDAAQVHAIAAGASEPFDPNHRKEFDKLINYMWMAASKERKAHQAATTKQVKNPIAFKKWLWDTRPDSKYDPQELAMGTEIEMKEHGLPKVMAKKIAKDHLDDIPNYYTILIKMKIEIEPSLKKFENPIVRSFQQLKKNPEVIANDAQSLFKARTYAYTLTKLLIVLLLKKQGGISSESIVEGVTPKAHLGFNATMITHALNDIFESANLNVEISLVDLFQVLKILPTYWVYKSSKAKNYFYVYDKDPIKQNERDNKLKKEIEKVIKVSDVIIPFLVKEIVNMNLRKNPELAKFPIYLPAVKEKPKEEPKERVINYAEFNDPRLYKQRPAVTQTKANPTGLNASDLIKNKSIDIWYGLLDWSILKVLEEHKEKTSVLELTQLVVDLLDDSYIKPTNMNSLMSAIYRHVGQLLKENLIESSIAEQAKLDSSGFKATRKPRAAYHYKITTLGFSVLNGLSKNIKSMINTIANTKKQIANPQKIPLQFKHINTKKNPTPTTKPVILIVEDNGIQAEMNSLNAQKYGFEPIIAYNGLEGITHLPEANVVCTDGDFTYNEEFYAALKKSGKPFIIVSGNDSFKGRGELAFVMKPAKTDEAFKLLMTHAHQKTNPTAKIKKASNKDHLIIQSVSFEKSYGIANAKKTLKHYGLKSSDVDKKPNTIRFRQHPPSHFTGFFSHKFINSMVFTIGKLKKAYKGKYKTYNRKHPTKLGDFVVPAAKKK